MCYRFTIQTPLKKFWGKQLQNVKKHKEVMQMD